jgi:hypothetical protein
MKKIGIYKITSLTEKVYIGQSVDIENRFKTYLRYACKSQPKLLASLKSHGSENHKYEILELCDKELLSIKEKYFVDLYQSFNSYHGLNVRDGGGNKASLSFEQKEKISNSLKGKKHTAERIEKNRSSQLGKKLSKEHKENIGKGVKGKMLGVKLSDEHRLKMSISRKGKIPWIKGKNHSEKTKQILREKSSGENNSNFGKQKTQESKNKTSESLKRYWQNKKELCQK